MIPQLAVDSLRNIGSASVMAMGFGTFETIRHRREEAMTRSRLSTAQPGDSAPDHPDAGRADDQTLHSGAGDQAKGEKKTEQAPGSSRITPNTIDATAHAFSAENRFPLFRKMLLGRLNDRLQPKFVGARDLSDMKHPRRMAGHWRAIA